MRTVYDVAEDILARYGNTSISTIALQKLVYLTFGWYARISGEKLFGQQFYAMKLGPVVGDLLALHSGTQKVSADELRAYRRSALRGQSDDSAYESVVDAVVGYYGAWSPWKLVDLTHSQSPWLDAWGSRQPDSQRTFINSESIIDYFASDARMPEALRDMLPEPRVIWADFDLLDAMDDDGEIDLPPAFVRTLCSLA